MIINLLCKTFITFLDFFLLNFFIKQSYYHIYQNRLKSSLIILYSIFSLCLVISDNLFINWGIYILLFISISICLFVQRFSFFQSFFTIFKFYLYKFIISIFIINLFSWIFNIRFSVNYASFVTPYSLFIYCTIRYVIYISIIMYFNIKSHFEYFKYISIFMFCFFGLTVIIDNPTLLYTISIARTYIFTVIISIVALICFDRMQSKYETDKHAKEAMIQNMTKEEEFIKQLQNQQLEIRKINHNLNNILIILQAHLKNGEYDEAMEYIEQNLKIHVKAYQDLTHTGIPTLDSILNNQMYLMKEKNIEYHEDITKILHLGNVKADDLSLAISLALDNAREACEKVDTPRQISLSLQSKQTHVVLYIANSIPQGSHPHFHKTTKADKIAHGHGVKSIKEIARKYHGDVKYDIKDNQVILRIMLQK